MFGITFPKWYKDALCVEVGGDVWFPETKGQPSKQAKEMCMKCPVREQCLELAVTDYINHGIWGATTPRQRVAIRRERGIPELEYEDDEE